MRFSYFSELLRNASCIIGNSSTGVREAPFLGVPSLDFGSRQHGRCHEPSITHANDCDGELILKFLSSKWGNRVPKSTEFGEGNAAKSLWKRSPDVVLGTKFTKRILRTIRCLILSRLLPSFLLEMDQRDILAKISKILMKNHYFCMPLTKP